MNLQDRYLDAIRAAYPEVRPGSVVCNTDGQNNDVLLVNGTLVFRFPKYEQALRRLRIEAAILSGIQDAVTLAVPAPIYLNLEGATVGEAFMGYRRIPGEPLWREVVAAIGDEEALDRLAWQLGIFLRELNSVPVGTAIAIELTPADPYEEYADMYNRMQHKLFPRMRRDAQVWATRHFETFLCDRDNFAHTPVLRHGDFGTSNILFDAQAAVVTGIIDFGNSGLGDPASDPAGLLSQYGEAFVRRLSGAYPGLDACWDRIVFYQGTFALQEALFGIENNDPQALASGLARYV